MNNNIQSTSPENSSNGTQLSKKPPMIYDLFEYVEIFVFSILAVLIIFTFFARLCKVDGSSMNNTLVDQQMLVISDMAYTPQNGDIIVFHQTGEYYNEPMVKRVIATAGQTIYIDFFNAVVKVDGVEVEEDYAFLKGEKYSPIGYAQYDFDIRSGIFETVVPEGSLFVMGDNRNNSTDSRFKVVGFVDERRVLGKVQFRLQPFKKF